VIGYVRAPNCLRRAGYRGYSTLSVKNSETPSGGRHQLKMGSYT